MPEIPNELIEKLRRSRRVVALTGAGISAESGIPTFREAQTGLWENYDPMELATPAAFRRNPKLVWDWYAWRRQLIAEAEPNHGHFALAEMETRFPDFQLVTQNVDGLHQKAGSKAIMELHGNIARVKCANTGKMVTDWTDDDPPRCKECADYVRPDVVWFQESLPQDTIAKAMDASLKADVFFAIGTSGMVHPAASLPIIAEENGAMLVEINPEQTPLSGIMNHVLRGPAAIILPLLVSQLLPYEF